MNPPFLYLRYCALIKAALSYFFLSLCGCLSLEMTRPGPKKIWMLSRLALR